MTITAVLVVNFSTQTFKFLFNFLEGITNQAYVLTRGACGHALSILSIMIIVILLEKLRNNCEGQIKIFFFNFSFV